MTRSGPAAIPAAFALMALDGVDASSPRESDAVSDSPRPIGFTGAIVVPTASRVGGDAQEAASLLAGEVVRCGSTDLEKHDPSRTVVVQPTRRGGMRVVLIAYD